MNLGRNAEEMGGMEEGEQGRKIGGGGGGENGGGWRSVAVWPVAKARFWTLHHRTS
jgi:hypothetical protein